MAFLRLRDPQAAVREIKRAIGIDPNHVEARTLLGYVELEVRGDVDAALKEYTKVIELRPELPEAYSNLAVAQKKKGDLDQAIASLNKALEQRKPRVSFGAHDAWRDLRRTRQMVRSAARFRSGAQAQSARRWCALRSRRILTRGA